MAGKLYLVSTPIGNLGDITLRARDTLAEAGFVAAEDTRVTLRLLNHLGLSKPLVSYYEQNAEASGNAILGRILGGEDCALVSDAGTPVISDPGRRLVELCASAGIEVLGIPGPCAAINALTVSGMPSGRFCFEGFLPVNRRNRRQRLKELVSETRTMIFFEAPHKLVHTLGDMLAELGDRPLAVCREMTKLHEECRRSVISNTLEYFTENTPRGEFVLIVGGAPEPEASRPDSRDAIELAVSYASEGMSAKDASGKAAIETGVSKNAIYSGVIERLRHPDQ